MRARATAAAVVLSHALSTLRPPNLNLPIKQVCFLFSLFLNKHRFSTTSPQNPPSSPSSSLPFTQTTNNSHIDLSSINTSGIAKSIFQRCSHLWENKSEDFVTLSLKDLLLKIYTVSPETNRKFLRVSELKPVDVLEILLGFEFESEKFEIEVQKVRSLWGIFNWASDQSKVFNHLPRSYVVMAKMLVRAGLFREIELLLSATDSEGILLDSYEIFSNLIEGYVGAGETQRAVSIYDRMRRQGLVPTLSCYRAILELLVRKNDTQLAFQVYLDMVEKGLGLSREETAIFENVVKLLCRDGRVHEVRKLVKKVITFGLKPTNLVIDAIASGYCEKKDFDDLLKFFLETKCALDVIVGNRVIVSMCRNFGVERANLFLQELENVGFGPDEITFGILIGWSCREGKLKNAFIYLSEILSRSLKPNVHSYNALISSVFREGMWKHAWEILNEMHDIGVTPNLATFKVLLAGYSEARQFDEVKTVVGEMVKRGLIQPSSLEDPLSKAFTLLGIDPLAVKVRRDNDTGFSKTEFFDNLGNGLYLETDLIEYEKTISRVLEDALIPDFNSLILKNCDRGNLKTAVMMVEEMLRWGQELSLTTFSTLVKGLCASSYGMKIIASLLEKMPKLTDQLDQETLNLLVQALSKKGFTHTARIIFDGMLQQNSKIKSETCTALLTGLCRKRNLTGLLNCWELARQEKWSLELKDYQNLIGFLCKKGRLKEALELFENTLSAYPRARSHICCYFLEKMCSAGFTTIAHALVEELQEQGFVLDRFASSHLIKGFLKERIISKALIMLDFMLEKNLVPSLDTISISISRLCWASKFEEAVALKESALREQSSISIPVYCALMSGFCKSGMVTEAANIFCDMLSRGLLPDSEACNVLIQGYCQTDDLMKVGELLGIMIRKNLSICISSYRNLVSLMCTTCRVRSALSLKELLLKESNHPNLIIYSILIFYLFRTGNNLFVDALVDELQEKGLQLDGVTYNFLVYGYSQCKDLSRSLQYLTTMMSEEHRPSNRSMRTVIKCLCGDGEIGKALELSREMESRGWVHDATIQNSIVEGLLARGKLKEAVSFLDRMGEKGLISNEINYDILIKRFCKFGKVDKAVDLLNIMLKKANIPSSSSYDYLIQDCCTCHKLDQALDLLTEMLDSNLNPSVTTWNVLIDKVCQEGQITEAERLLNVMVQMGEKPTREMFCSVINRCHYERNLSKASEILQMMQQNGYEPDFETHWSFISNLSNSNDNSNNKGRPFLSRLLSESGFA
ncbi:pentatricopeptide repeat-containing protein At5g15280, mitochondrial-like [Actinidia eriantha]|uniref:pentatricopeptide repeat-containing protein At5g15280, mitochondrial-like n=1 Tax=Actinidia eriantha TaxID=165200 RepID=UPI002588AF1A|nr:pentatricopeptide repeat-containing protein At5g15280, mitochondrial-like [Actinidia eriantha]